MEIPQSLPVHAVIQARMTSERLPGKILTSVHGMNLLEHLVCRLERCEHLDGIVIATSTDVTDEPVMRFALTHGLRCHRGDLNDVAARMAGAARRFGIQHIARISGDSPMLDPGVADLAIDTYRKTGADLVTNVQQRTYPKGQSVEIFSASLLEEAMALGMTPCDREHVTPFFYRHAGKYRIENLSYTGNRGDAQLSVDTDADLKRFSQIMERLGPPFWRHGLEALLSAYDALEVKES